MTLWFSATAAAPAIAREFALEPGAARVADHGGAGGIRRRHADHARSPTLADAINARRLFAIGCVAGAASNAGDYRSRIARRDHRAALLHRRRAGLGLSAGHEDRRRLVSRTPRHRARHRRRRPDARVRVPAPARVAGRGTAVARRSSAPPRSLALAGGAHRRLRPSRTARTSARPRRSIATPSASSSANRGARLAMLGYFGHMWELYAMWTWIAAFAARRSAPARPRRGRDAAPPSRSSRSRAARSAASSAGCGPTAGARRRSPVPRCSPAPPARCSRRSSTARRWPRCSLLAVVWGFTVVADSAQFSALVDRAHAATHVGTALTLQTSAGFLLTMVSIGCAADGRRSAAGSGPSCSGPGPLLGARR